MEIAKDYTPINTRAELAAAVARGLSIYLSWRGNSPDGGYIPGDDVVERPEWLDSSFDEYRWRVLGMHDLSGLAKPEQAEPEPPAMTNADFEPGDIVRYAGREWEVGGIDDGAPSAGLMLLRPGLRADFPGEWGDHLCFAVTRGSNARPEGSKAFDDWRWGDATESQLVSRSSPKAESSPEQAKPEPRPYMVGDVVRLTATPEFTGVPVGTLAVVEKTRSMFGYDHRGLRGVNGETLWDGESGLLWVDDDEIELVEAASQPEPGPEPSILEQLAEQAEADELDIPLPGFMRPEAQFNPFDTGPRFRISVTIEADTEEGYKAALTTLAEGI